MELNSLTSALQSAINLHNEAHEHKVSMRCFFIRNNETSIFIKGEHRDILQATATVRSWGAKIRKFTDLYFSILALYPLPTKRKTIYYKETFND